MTPDVKPPHADVSARLPAWLARHSVLIAILALAAAMRLMEITLPLIDSFSWRQASTAMMADNFRLQSWNIFYPEVSWTGPGPSYQGREFQLLSYITAILHAIFGWHDWLGRLVAAGFGMIAVFSLHRLVAHVWDAHHAHAAALVYAILPAAVTIESSFLPDPAMLAMITLGVWLFVRYWSGQGGIGLLALATLAFTIGVLSKLPGIAAAGVIGYLAIVAGLRAGWARQVPTFVAMALSLAVLAGYYAWAVYLGNTYPPFHVAGDGYIWDYGLRHFLDNGFFIGRLYDTARWWFYGIPLLALFLVGLWMSPPTAGADRVQAAVPMVWLAGCVALYLVAALQITNNPWNLHIFSVPFAIFAGRGLIVLLDLSRTPLSSRGGVVRMTAAIAALAMLSSWSLIQEVRKPYALNGLYLGQALEALSAPGDLVVAVSPTVGDPIAIYYSRRRGWVFPEGGGSRTWSILIDDPDAAVTELEDLRARGAGWFGFARNATDGMRRRFVDHHAPLLDHLDETAELVADTPAYVIYRLAP